VQLIQLSWSLTHPYLYIYPIWLTMSGLFGAQFGLLTALMTKERVMKWSGPLFFASLWTLFEWSHLFILSGISWNPVGLAFSTYLIPLQAGSILGLYGLSFLVILTNLYALRFMIAGRSEKWPFIGLVLFPYLFGLIHLAIHYPKLVDDLEDGRVVDVLLVQPGFPVEEVMELHDPQSTLLYSHGKWKQILSILARHRRQGIDMIVLPEYVVPFGTYYPVFPYESVKREFKALFGEDGLKALPSFEEHLATFHETPQGKIYMVNNAYWIQGISNLFNAEVVAGLEDSDALIDQSRRHYSSALVFFPHGEAIERYEKRVLVPFGEYIPFEFLRAMAANYGVISSFTPGSQAKVIAGRCSSYGLSICYEETYGNVMRDNRLQGAEMLVNLTNDFWYPRSRLPQQHFDHARLRAIEMGIPLVRATNTGVTAAVDSIGQTLAVLGNDYDDRENLSDALQVTVPRYHFRTIYTYLGDPPLILFCALFASLSLLLERKRKLKLT
jgi:apolipoprotein N-acyltransferase